MSSLGLPESSPSSGSRLRRSRFTYKQLSLLSQSSTTCPLRVIAHIDLDAFYAQCEMVRLGVADDQPLAVQQWQGLIAINYPARAFGLNRHVNIDEAVKLCPELIIQHVATWREGEDRWAYRPDSFKQIHTDKVSLDPYRLQARRILATIKDVLPPAPLQKVEKASIDEVFLDLSAQVHSILLTRFPELAGPPPYDDPSENLLLPPSTVLSWKADALVDLDSSQTEDDDPDWDDVAMLIGSEIVRDVRQVIRDRLKYTCSAGLAKNKMMAKLGSGHQKPNSQTVVRNRAIQNFLSEFKFTKIRNLGGKLGDHVVSTFETDELTQLLKIPLEQLKAKLGPDTGAWLYGIIRGEDHSEVNPRTQIKSMLSAKSFRPTIDSIDQAEKWLRIFVADIYARLVEEGVVENKRRPKTMNLHHRHIGQTRSKQLPIPPGRKIDETSLFELAKTLLGQIVVDGRAWPCANLSLSVGGFEDGVTGNRGIGGFLVRGEEARITNAAHQGHLDGHEASQDEYGRPPPGKRRRKFDSDGSGIQRFLRKASSDDTHSLGGFPAEATKSKLVKSDHGALREASRSSELESEADDHPPPDLAPDHYRCGKCQAAVMVAEMDEHNDWHFAKDLQEVERVGDGQEGGKGTTGSQSNKARRQHASSDVAAVGGNTLPKGQKKLAFG